MRLTSFTDYNLRVLIYLALEHDGLATVEEIAKAYAISENNLRKVVHHLAKSGIIESLRGKGGGIRLAVAPEKIRLGAVIRAAEGDSPIVECFSTHDTCRITPNCKLAGILAKSFADLFAALDAYTLADLVAQPAPLLRRLGRAD
jgi:Rrf2 family nitric oxide-sensitive transcriptional repressor